MAAILVTGGTGFIGSALVRRLVKDGHRVRVFDNDSRGSSRRLKDLAPRIEIVHGDIRDPAAVAEACSGMETVVHLAFINGTEFFYSKPDLVLEVGVKGICNILDGSLAQGVKEFFLASSSEVYQTPPAIPTDETVPLSIPDPLNPRYSYAGGKIISELMTINVGRKRFTRAVVFRPHNVYGPDMGSEHVIPQFIMRMKEICRQTGEKAVDFPVQGTGKQTRAFIFIDDFVEAFMTVMHHAEHLGIYHLGTMGEVTMEDVAREVGRYFGREVRIVPGKEAAGGTLRRCPDTAKLKALGFRPAVSLRDGIIKTAAWYDRLSPEEGQHG